MGWMPGGSICILSAGNGGMVNSWDWKKLGSMPSLPASKSQTKQSRKRDHSTGSAADSLSNQRA